jgi:hypothetical protein
MERETRLNSPSQLILTSGNNLGDHHLMHDEALPHPWGPPWSEMQKPTARPPMTADAAIARLLANE